MDWGDKFDTIINAAIAAEVPISSLPCVATKPDLFGHLQFEWSAFRALSTDRQLGMDMGPIPWQSVDRFASRYGLVEDDFDRLCTLVMEMDGAYRKYHQKKE